MAVKSTTQKAIKVGRHKIDKVIVTNLSALKAKYGETGTKQVTTAIQGLITADKKRGLLTRLIPLDDNTLMQNLNAPAVVNPADPRQNKRAIDGIYKALTPDYILILGAVDVVPHQDLKNPAYDPSPEGDPDPLAYGDLPYACEAGYSQKPQDFFGPTRVIGRLPDITGEKNPQYLIRLLNTARAYKTLGATPYQDYFGISAQIWQGSTALSLTNTFGGSADLKTVPLSSFQWSSSLLRKRSHFINCHGAPESPQFYGQPASGARQYPVALDAAYISKKIKEGTVASVECCYGAQLYDPALAQGRAGISNTYLASRAYGFFGSTTIAYGPETGNDSADLLCQYFLQSLLRGASIGRAALEARQRFLQVASMSNPFNVKTIAQFNLYGDPSLSPVRSASPHATPALGGNRKLAIAAVARVERTERRRDLFLNGLSLGASQSVIKKLKGKPAKTVEVALRKTARAHNVPPAKILTFDVQRPPQAKSLPKSMVRKTLLPTRVYVVFSEKKAAGKKSGAEAKSASAATPVSPPVPQIEALVVNEINGKIISAVKTLSR